MRRARNCECKDPTRASGQLRKANRRSAVKDILAVIPITILVYFHAVG